MEVLKIEKTKISPLVYFSTEEPLLIEGDSRPEFCSEFYQPLLEWLKALEIVTKTNLTQEKFELIIGLEYVNSSSIIYLSKVLKQVNTIATLEHVTFSVLWKTLAYDEDMRDLGEEFQEIYQQLNFSFVS